jgi:hypothetical protein
MSPSHDENESQGSFRTQSGEAATTLATASAAGNQSTTDLFTFATALVACEDSFLTLTDLLKKRTHASAGWKGRFNENGNTYELTILYDEEPGMPFSQYTGKEHLNNLMPNTEIPLFHPRSSVLFCQRSITSRWQLKLTLGRVLRASSRAS